MLAYWPLEHQMVRASLQMERPYRTRPQSFQLAVPTRQVQQRQVARDAQDPLRQWPHDDPKPCRTSLHALVRGHFGLHVSPLLVDLESKWPVFCVWVCVWRPVAGCWLSWGALREVLGVLPDPRVFCEGSLGSPLGWLLVWLFPHGK